MHCQIFTYTFKEFKRLNIKFQSSGFLKMKETGLYHPSFGKQVQMASLGGRQVEWALLCQPHSTPGRWPPASLVCPSSSWLCGFWVFLSSLLQLSNSPLPEMIWMSQSLSTHTTCRTRNKTSTPHCHDNMLIIGELLVHSVLSVIGKNSLHLWIFCSKSNLLISVLSISL